jgi:ATP-binding cassette subfamily F protein 3
MVDPPKRPHALAGLAVGELAKRRAELCDELETAEAQWLKLSERLETCD